MVFLNMGMPETSFFKPVRARVSTDHELLTEFVAGSDLYQYWTWEVLNYPDGSGVLVSGSTVYAVRRVDGKVYMPFFASMTFCIRPEDWVGIGITVDDELFEQALASVKFADRMRKGAGHGSAEDV